MPICKGCGAKIDWIKTKAGKNMPINTEYMGIYPIEPGCKEELIVTIVTDYGEVKRGLWAPDGAGIARGRVPHFATCPQAKNFKRSGKSA